MKRIIYGILLLIILFASGCANTGQTDTALSPYIGGTKGIIANFEPLGILNEAAGTEEIFEGEGFPIEITLKNKGEEDISVGGSTVKLLGISMNDYSGITGNGVLTNPSLIEKVSNVNKEGGEITIDFTPATEKAKYKVPLAGSTYTVNIFAEIIYNYKTFAEVPKVCFKEDFTSQEICEIDEVKTVYSSGAPIQVMSAEEKRAGTGKIAVEFDVENIGGGNVAVRTQEFNPRYDQFAFKSSDDNLWECKSKGVNEGRFDSTGHAKIICKLKDTMAKGTLYTKSLGLILEYKYKFLAQSSVRIVKQ